MENGSFFIGKLFWKKNGLLFSMLFPVIIKSNNRVSFHDWISFQSFQDFLKYCCWWLRSKQNGCLSIFRSRIILGIRSCFCLPFPYCRNWLFSFPLPSNFWVPYPNSPPPHFSTSFHLFHGLLRFVCTTCAIDSLLRAKKKRTDVWHEIRSDAVLCGEMDDFIECNVDFWMLWPLASVA